MPSSAEHVIRIKEGMAFLEDELARKYPNELVTSYFYTCLHMFEATVFDFTPKGKKRHFFTHGERTVFLSSVRFDPFFYMVADYEALRGLSEQARYLSPAGVESYEPLRVPADIEQARHAIKRSMEVAYSAKKKQAPWT